MRGSRPDVAAMVEGGSAEEAQSDFDFEDTLDALMDELLSDLASADFDAAATRTGHEICSPVAVPGLLSPIPDWLRDEPGSPGDTFDEVPDRPPLPPPLEAPPNRAHIQRDSQSRRIPHQPSVCDRKHSASRRFRGVMSFPCKE